MRKQIYSLNKKKAKYDARNAAKIRLEAFKLPTTLSERSSLDSPYESKDSDAELKKDLAKNLSEDERIKVESKGKKATGDEKVVDAKVEDGDKDEEPQKGKRGKAKDDEKTEDGDQKADVEKTTEKDDETTEKDNETAEKDNETAEKDNETTEKDEEKKDGKPDKSSGMKSENSGDDVEITESAKVEKPQSVVIDIEVAHEKKEKGLDAAEETKKKMDIKVCIGFLYTFWFSFKSV